MDDSVDTIHLPSARRFWFGRRLTSAIQIAGGTGAPDGSGSLIGCKRKEGTAGRTSCLILPPSSGPCPPVRGSVNF